MHTLWEHTTHTHARTCTLPSFRPKASSSSSTPTHWPRAKEVAPTKRTVPSGSPLDSLTHTRLPTSGSQPSAPLPPLAAELTLARLPHWLSLEPLATTSAVTGRCCGVRIGLPPSPPPPEVAELGLLACRLLRPPCSAVCGRESKSPRPAERTGLMGTPTRGVDALAESTSTAARLDARPMGDVEGRLPDPDVLLFDRSRLFCAGVPAPAPPPAPAATAVAAPPLPLLPTGTRTGAPRGDTPAPAPPPAPSPASSLPSPACRLCVWSTCLSGDTCGGTCEEC